MSRITLQTVATAQDAAKPRLQAALDANGFLPNLLAVLANAPGALQMYQEVGKINAATSLTRRRQTAAIFASPGIAKSPN